MNGRNIKKSILIAVLLITSQIFAACSATVNIKKPGDTGKIAKLDYLGQQLEDSADHLLMVGEDVDDIYTELN
ncbi:MAG: hypothetical protein K6G67_05730 [Lachnospiraceae bacterium]|nr:hypothetical protein [Lachnospiraceae bacterium]